MALVSVSCVFLQRFLWFVSCRSGRSFSDRSVTVEGEDGGDMAE